VKAQAIADARAGKIADVKTEYAREAAFNEPDADGFGGVDTLCNYPPADADGVVGPRTTCFVEGSEDVLCCGAAQRFLKDGTKLSIETCQLADATTYKYYPALPVDAVVAPTPEIWRFQCISAAQKLAAAATAALAAGYMMA
jgi:hypothetical protein